MRFLKENPNYFTQKEKKIIIWRRKLAILLLSNMHEALQ